MGAVFFVLAVSLGLAYATGHVARKRNRSFWLWLVLGMFFSGFALVLVYLLPKGNKAASGTACPVCTTAVTANDSLCPKCGCKLATA